MKITVEQKLKIFEEGYLPFMIDLIVDKHLCGIDSSISFSLKFFEETGYMFPLGMPRYDIRTFDQWLRLHYQTQKLSLL